MDDPTSGNSWSPFSSSTPSDPPAEPAPGPEFLFHLYRGSELLKEDHVDEAKHELEKALAMQPRDIEGQSLLGVVYFRLGHYPRAIQIYEDLVRLRPTEIPPKINLALCYLKTGQAPTARALLEEVVQMKADHVRAWGYLGLAYQRLGDLDKACVAFERAGRPQVAERLRQASSAAAEGLDEAMSLSPAIEEIGHGHARAVLQPVTADTGDAAPVATPPASLAPATTVAVPEHASRFCREVLLTFPENPRVVTHRDGSVLVRIEAWFGIRADTIRALSPDAGPFSRRSLHRRYRGTDSHELLGGAAHPLVAIIGAGRLLVAPPPAQRALCLVVADEPFYVREDRLLGFEPSVAYENGRVSLGGDEQVSVVQLSGRGTAIFCSAPAMGGLAVAGGKPVHVRGDKVLGWNGRLLPKAVALQDALGQTGGYVEFIGDGTVLIETG